MTPVEAGCIYAAGLVAIPVLYGIWQRTTSIHEPYTFAPFVWVGMWVWPLVVPVVLLGLFGDWVGYKIVKRRNRS
jgi:hypothetical protein